MKADAYVAGSFLYPLSSFSSSLDEHVQHYKVDLILLTAQLAMFRGSKDYYHQNGGNGKCLTIFTS
jgi:hypothetical protein